MFFGHYALKNSVPAPMRANVGCLDYGSGKDGKLCAYRWGGEQHLDASKFLAVAQGSRAAE